VFTGFFGLTRQPFTSALPADALFRSPALEEALARLRFVLDQQGIGLLCGEPGAGKSATLRALVAACDPARHKFIYLTAPRSTRALLQTLCHALGLEPAWFAAELQRQVVSALARLDDHGVIPVLLCDEAHLAPIAVLEELRLLTNTAMDAHCPAAIVLAGHQSLRRRLELESLAPLAQRVAVSAPLPALSAPQTADYIAHQLQWAGATRPLFTRDVIELVAHYSRGVPRQINRLCTAALFAAFTVQQPLVEEPAFRQALKEVQPESA
jgi:type II secretory pathway predicted ATPase ExeA